MRKLSKKNKSYFTLVEMMAALAVMGFVGLIIATASATIYNTWRLSGRQTERLREFQRIDTVMDSLVGNLIPFHWPDEDNDSGSDLLFGGETDRVFFPSLRRSYGSGALIFVRIKLDGSDLIADYSRYPRFPWVDEKDESLPWEREVLASGVRSVRFRYADKTSDRVVEWIDDWDNSERPMPPLAIRMIIEWQDGHTESWLRRTAGSGANRVFGEREEVTANASNGSTN